MTTKIVKRLPYGTSNFEKLISENYAYVDKTPFIEQLENEANPYQFFIRPRKFGKSLLLSMLSHYYDINRAAQFESLFGELYIGKHPTPHKNGYGIIEFNFSGLNTYSEEDFRASFSHKVQDTVLAFIGRYRHLFPRAEELTRKIDQEKPGIDALLLAYNEARIAGIKIFVLIDEYDHFANDLIAMGNQLGDDVYRRMVRANGLVRDFYETLKIGTSDVLDRIFITGISPVMLDDLTSGFNMAAILTLDLAYNEMMGFTRQEVDALMV
ncbi:MAG: AAA family ATPase, partial [Tannerellaceae bacterium]|nr:AAA family ATPase [Tannerellaceae bacterium]